MEKADASNVAGASELGLGAAMNHAKGTNLQDIPGILPYLFTDVTYLTSSK